EIECSQNAVLRRPERQVDEWNRRFHDILLAARAAVWTLGPGLVRVAVERAVLDDAQRRQQRTQPAGRGTLGRALLAADEHAADGRVDGIQQQRRLQRLLTNQCAEGIVHGSLLPHWAERKCRAASGYTEARSLRVSRISSLFSRVSRR